MTSTYSETEVVKMTDMYSDNPGLETVDKLSVLLNRPRKSIISKLVKEGVYIRRGYLTKTGETPITKLQIVRSIEDALDTKLPGLDKAPKSTLKALEESLIEVSTLLEDALGELKDRTEVQKVSMDMLEAMATKGHRR